MQFQKKRTLICGLQGMGKSTLAEAILSKHFGAIAIDPQNEYGDLPQFVPKTRDYDGIKVFLRSLRGLRPKLVIVDEANRFFPAKEKLPTTISEEYDFQRHNDCGWVFVVRRPQSLNVDLLDLIDQLVIFKLVGIGDLGFLKSVNPGLEVEVKALNEHEFMLSDYKSSKKLRLEGVKAKENKKDGNESADDESG